tara:strand:- start:151 stop:1326 length:1176 start_codon:yes stop_codon:yes gene_type:complete
MAGVEKILGFVQGKIDGQLIKISKKAKEEGKKKILKLRDKLPSEEQLKQKLKQTSCNPGNRSKMERIYKKMKKFLEGLKNAINKALKLLGFLKGLIDMIGKLLKIILVILGILLVILIVLSILIVVAKIVVKFLGGTFTGGLIDFLSRAIVKAESFRDKWMGHIKVAKKWCQDKFKKYIRPIIDVLAKAILAVTGILGFINFLLSILEMLYVMTLQKCALEDQKLGADTNTQDGGLDGDGNGSNQAIAALALINASSPEEIIGRIAQTGNDEFIHYIRNANFETIGYERFNAVFDSDDTSNKPWPLKGSGPSKSNAVDKAGDLGIYRDGDEKVIPPSDSTMGNIIADIRDIEKEGNHEKASKVRPGKIKNTKSSKRTSSGGTSSGGGGGGY